MARIKRVSPEVDDVVATNRDSPLKTRQEFSPLKGDYGDDLF